ncbi:hypothetical protein [Streptomyces sp. CBMA29]|uniref:hypothetical protein n=1 Tax=Streptomyces sp. CBMA29 TaxID=1896314 RepID=UPI001661FAF3|nr:hypothetical protein [Streptomyces sp. CBMA29]MBD0738063.1 hypothetical protein [Streptomyces sp. CBMA29]
MQPLAPPARDVKGRPPIYGYMRAYDSTPEDEVMRDELRLFRWAQVEGYDLAAVYQELEEGSIAVLTELVEELKRNGDRMVVVPSVEHFGDSSLLQEHLWAYVVHTANAEVFEAVGPR